MGKKLYPLSKNPRFASNFFSADESNLDTLIGKIKRFHDGLNHKSDISGKRPIKMFKYSDMINANFFTKRGHTSLQVTNEIKQIFDGTVKWHSPKTAFNITSTPLLDTVAASTLTNLLNPNCLWDLPGGKFVLAEKNLINLLGNRILKSNNSDGLSTFGGKGTLLYAIKTGLGNCDPEHKKRGLQGKYAVVVSYTTHFCVADVCDYVGIGSDSLLKIPLLPTGEMNYEILKTTLDKAISTGVKIATVVCNGGTTIDFCMDNAKKIRKITNALEKKHNLPYKIHIHGDTVFGWAWLFTNEARLIESDCSSANKLLKIRKMLNNMPAVDSIGVDFHKMGLCPHNSSFFVVKNKQKLDLLGGNVTAVDDGFFGNKHLHYNSIENSKSGTGIISAYTALYALGEYGITDYLIYLMKVKEKYVELINNQFNHIFTILNHKSLGFEIVITATVDGQPFEKEDYINLCHNIWYAEDCPIMTSQVQRYFCGGKPHPAILLYSMSPHVSEQDCVFLLTRLEEECRKIASHKKKNSKGANHLFVPR